MTIIRWPGTFVWLPVLFAFYCFMLVNGDTVLYASNALEAQRSSSVEFLKGRSTGDNQKSPALAISLDLLIPGGGHFYNGHYIESSFWMGVKIGLGYLAYHFHQKQGAASSADNGLSDNANSISKGRTAMHTWYAIYAQMGIYALSSMRVYQQTLAHNRHYWPTFELTGSIKTSGPIELALHLTFHQSF